MIIKEKETIAWHGSKILMILWHHTDLSNAWEPTYNVWNRSWYWAERVHHSDMVISFLIQFLDQRDLINFRVVHNVRSYIVCAVIPGWELADNNWRIVALQLFHIIVKLFIICWIYRLLRFNENFSLNYLWRTLQHYWRGWWRLLILANHGTARKENRWGPVTIEMSDYLQQTLRLLIVHIAPRRFKLHLKPLWNDLDGNRR